MNDQNVTMDKGALTPRRSPVPVDRYRRAVHLAQARLPRRRRLPPRVAALCWAVLLAGAGLIGVRAAGGLAAVPDDFGSFVVDLVPPATAADIALADPAGLVAVAPIFDGLSEFTATPSLLVQGRVRAFSPAGGQRLEIVLNAGVAAPVQIDGNGRFAIPLGLRDGPNLIVATLLRGREVAATSSLAVVLDRVPPPLSIAIPKPSDLIAGPDVLVEGKAEPYATVTVNGRYAVVDAAGIFTETFSAPPGPLTIAVVARDRAGNETTVSVAVAVRESAAAAALALTVALDRGTVRPGEPVTATIRLAEGTRPRGDTTVSLSVGVVAIGSARTDKTGTARITFAAPPNEGAAQVVVLGGGAWGSAELIVAR